jgi:hypothetical protein
MVRLDSLYKIRLLPGVEAPPGFNPSDDHFLIIEYEGQRLAANISKHMYYAAAVVQEYYNNLEKSICIDITTIYSPKILSIHKSSPSVYGIISY